MLSITLGERVESESGATAIGHITIGEFNEAFIASLAYWDHAKYYAQWNDGLNRVLSGYDRSILIVDMYRPATANFLDCWLLYRVGDNVCLQNKLMFMRDLDRRFDEEEPYIHVQERITENQEGQAISEWCVEIAEVQVALARFPKL